MNDAAFLPALAALASAATWALGSHLFRRAFERAGAGPPPTAAAANLFKNALAFVLFAAILPLFGGALPAQERWPALLVSGAFGFALGDTLYFAALPRCGVQVAAMVGLVHVPAAALMAWALHGEALPLGAGLGALGVLAGVALVVTEAPRGRVRARRDVRAGVVLAALGAIAQAAGVVTGHAAMQGAEVLGGTLVRMSGGIAGAFALALPLGLVPLLRRGPTRVTGEVLDLVRPWRQRAARVGLLQAALFGSVIGLPLFHFGLRGLPSGVAATLFATTPLFALPIGAALGERHGARAVFGALLGCAGVAGVVASVA